MVADAEVRAVFVRRMDACCLRRTRLTRVASEAAWVRRDVWQGPVPTSAVLMAAWTHLATKCATQNKAFMACKKADRDPKACLAAGDEVSSCTVKVLKDLHATCGSDLNAYAKCMDWYSNDFERCRDAQKAFENTCKL